MDVEKITKRGYVRTLVWWPFLLVVLPLFFGVGLAVRIALHHWVFEPKLLFDAMPQAIMMWLGLAGLWRYRIRKEGRR